MKTKVLYFLIWIVGIVQCFGQTASKTPPVIDMHLHVYSAKSYWGGTDYVLKDTILPSPKNNIDHIKAVLELIKKHNISLTYASGAQLKPQIQMLSGFHLFDPMSVFSFFVRVISDCPDPHFAIPFILVLFSNVSLKEASVIS